MEEEVLVLVEVTGFNPTGITPAGWPPRPVNDTLAT